jgi:hypothetical protein
LILVRYRFGTGLGAIYYNADGVGGELSMEFAVLDNHATLTSADFVGV